MDKERSDDHIIVRISREILVLPNEVFLKTPKIFEQSKYNEIISDDDCRKPRLQDTILSKRTKFVNRFQRAAGEKKLREMLDACSEYYAFIKNKQNIVTEDYFQWTDGEKSITVPHWYENAAISFILGQLHSKFANLFLPPKEEKDETTIKERVNQSLQNLIQARNFFNESLDYIPKDPLLLLDQEQEKFHSILMISSLVCDFFGQLCVYSKCGINNTTNVVQKNKLLAKVLALVQKRGDELNEYLKKTKSIKDEYFVHFSRHSKMIIDILLPFISGLIRYHNALHHLHEKNYGYCVKHFEKCIKKLSALKGEELLKTLEWFLEVTTQQYNNIKTMNETIYHMSLPDKCPNLDAITLERFIFSMITGDKLEKTPTIEDKKPENSPTTKGDIVQMAYIQMAIGMNDAQKVLGEHLKKPTNDTKRKLDQFQVTVTHFIKALKDVI